MVLASVGKRYNMSESRECVLFFEQFSIHFSYFGQLFYYALVAQVLGEPATLLAF